MTKVLGLFAQEDVNKAIDMLGEYGFADDYKVLDRFNVHGSQMVAVPGQGTAEGSASVPDVAPTSGSEVFGSETAGGKERGRNRSAGPSRNREAAISQLTDYEIIDRSQAEYLANAIYNGASLIVLDVQSEDEVETAKNLMDKAGAQSYSQ